MLENCVCLCVNAVCAMKPQVLLVYLCCVNYRSYYMYIYHLFALMSIKPGSQYGTIDTGATSVVSITEKTFSLVKLYP